MFLVASGDDEDETSSATGSCAGGASGVSGATAGGKSALSSVGGKSQQQRQQQQQQPSCKYNFIEQLGETQSAVCLIGDARLLVVHPQDISIVLCYHSFCLVLSNAFCTFEQCIDLCE